MSRQIQSMTEIDKLLVISNNLVTSVKEVQGEIGSISSRLEKVEKTMTIDSRSALNIKLRAERHVSGILGGKESDRYKNHYRSTIRRLWHDYWNIFGITTYKDTPSVLYDQAIEFIDKWRPISPVDNDAA